MLSAFTARPIVELKPKERGKIDSLLSYGDRLLVGLSTGALRVYRINELGSDVDPAHPRRPPSQPLSETAELAEEYERFAKYKVEQLASIKEANILVVLAGAVVSVYDLKSYQLQDSLVKTKGATTFAVTSNIVQDDATGVPSIVSRLAVAVKRKLLLWSWHDSELVDANPELTLVTGIRTLTWIAGTKLIAGLTTSYVLVDVETQEVTDIEGPGSIGGGPGQDASRFSAGMGYMGMGGIAPKPLATRLSEGEVLLAKDVNTHFIDTEGRPLGRKQVPWATAPEAIGYSYPFLLALQSSKGTLEIRNPETLGALQAISLPQATILHVPNPYVRLAHAGKGFLVASDKCIWRMEALGYDAQIASLVENRRYDEAISLLNLLEDALLTDKDGSLRECKVLKAQGLFERRQYRPALDLLTEASAPPEGVIGLYPREIAGDLAAGETRSESVKDPKATKEPAESDPKEEINHPPADTDPASLAPDKSDAVSVLSASMQNSVDRPILEGEELRKATIELQGFLVNTRTKLQRFINFDGTLKQDADEDINENKAQAEQLLTSRGPSDTRSYEKKLLDTATLVDTTLFRAYMLAQPSLAGSLFRLPNFCDSHVVREKLAEKSRYADLIDFFYGKNLHREALEMLHELGHSKDKSKIPEQLQGPARTVLYLQNLDASHADLILDFADWPLRKDPDLGMEIFLADSENAENLPRRPVAEFLGKIDAKLETRYLEHLINELNDTTPEFHQRLLVQYLDAAKAAKKAKDAVKTESLAKLVDFLRTSRHFEPWRFLTLIPKDDPDFYEVRAITLGKLDQHRQALGIYVFDMRNAAKAEEYCNQVYVAETSTGSLDQATHDASTAPSADSSIYTDLLSLYLTPPPPHEPQWGHGLDLLAKHGPRVSATAALNLLPDALDVTKMQQYLTMRLRTAQSELYATRIAAALRKTLDEESVTTLRLQARNRNVLITEDRVCGVCHKRFGGSAIKVMPDNSAVHYGCSVRSG